MKVCMHTSLFCICMWVMVVSYLGVCIQLLEVCTGDNQNDENVDNGGVVLNKYKIN